MDKEAFRNIAIVGNGKKGWNCAVLPVLFCVHHRLYCYATPTVFLSSLHPQSIQYIVKHETPSKKINNIPNQTKPSSCP